MSLMTGARLPGWEASIAFCLSCVLVFLNMIGVPTASDELYLGSDYFRNPGADTCTKFCFPELQCPVPWENQDCWVCQCLVAKMDVNWGRIKRGWPGHRGRRGRLISGTASVGKRDPSASGFNEKGPSGNLKSGSASNPQSSGSLE